MQSIRANIIPPPSGLDKEEPEIAQEDDIPADDKTEDGNRWARGETGDD
jgi:hypothetical protein